MNLNADTLQSKGPTSKLEKYVKSEKTKDIMKFKVPVAIEEKHSL